jgi:hypothetical protein
MTKKAAEIVAHVNTVRRHREIDEGPVQVEEERSAIEKGAGWGGEGHRLGIA